MRLVSLYLPLSSTSDLKDSDWTEEDPARGTIPYYLRCIGARRGAAQLYLEAGLLHLEGAASTLLSASYSSLSSIRMPLQSQIGEGGTAAWKRDREAAAKYFERARALQPDLDIPSLPIEFGTLIPPVDNQELEIPSLDLAATSTPEHYQSGPESESLGNDDAGDSGAEYEDNAPTIRRRRRKTEVDNFVNAAAASKTETSSSLEEMEDQWYLYIPSLVGAGTALLVLGVVGVLSISNWSRRSQSS